MPRRVKGGTCHDIDPDVAAQHGRKTTRAGTESPSELTVRQRFLIADLFANPNPSPAGSRPRVEPRRCFEAIVWVPRSQAHWKDLPGKSSLTGDLLP